MFDKWCSVAPLFGWLATIASGLLLADSFGPMTIPICAILGVLLLVGSIYGWSFETA